MWRGAKEKLGLEDSGHMKGLQVFISDIRKCTNKDEEKQRVEQEMAKIRLKFTQTKALSGYDKKKYVWKLLYAYMLGYDVDFGHIQSVELCSSTKFSEKSAGYLAISLLLADNNDVLRLVVNCVKTDMTSHREHDTAIALNTVANIAGSEFADNLFADISKLLMSNSGQFSPYLKRKACICLLRLYRKDNDILQPDVWRQKLASLFRERDIGFLTSISGFALAILEMGNFPIHEWQILCTAVLECLQRIVPQQGHSDCPADYEYYHVAAPWLQTKLLRILQFFPSMSYGEDLHKVNTVLQRILTKSPTQRQPPSPGTNAKKRKADAERQNRSNAEHCILFEAMNLMIHLEDACEADTMRTASTQLGHFIASSDANIRYLGLETMARLATNAGTFEMLERYTNPIMERLNEPDVSIKRQALNLLYALCRPENWNTITQTLLDVLGNCDALLQEELVLKIAILAEKNARTFMLYVDVVFKMLESAPDAVNDDVWYRVVQVVTGFEDGENSTGLQRHAASEAFKRLSSELPHETLVKLGAWLIGEFGHLLPENIGPRSKFESLIRHYQQVGTETKTIIVFAIAKLLNASPEALHRDVHSFLEEMSDQQDVELQQRACELMKLSKNEQLYERVLEPVPPYSEHVQANNPLIQRLKFQHKNRAHTRAQLEHAAKSEGGIYKQGTKHMSQPGTPRSVGPGTPRSGGPLALGDISRSPRDNNRARQESDSDSDSDSEDDASKPVMLWQNLCIVPQGTFYTSSSLSLDLKQEYSTHQGRIHILFKCNASVANIRVQLPDTPFMRFKQDNQPPTMLMPGQSHVHTFQLQCLRPFLQPAKYLVEYTEAHGPVTQLPLNLPAVLTKFVVPAEVPMPAFRQMFESFGGPKQEGQSVGVAKVPPGQWPNYLTKGFNMYMLQESNQSTAFAAGTFQTATPDPSNPGKMMTVPSMIKLDYDPNRQMTRITVRTQHGDVTLPLLKIVEKYLLKPQG
mmetsp:Transcript_39540/g.62810  ORF Transcript_39540/g.62810 Transcript_39540/m.62810 type:complete len:980 (+) Transcript_39540:99-3038(+)|eukprot:CAMPEP_0169063188 /NCGR_PEP_ID=MMETSP1015-20121227/1138_1 /TAXON_ID=342587 /ORGANISM="Karlodinium micrum, Strain CCMP2283" /LENGTH=979 /DNA_ID=CAMNT_0009121481 /DNA_START=16 /DNA_END=2955 /DNA_ORIENTATION=+